MPLPFRSLAGSAALLLLAAVCPAGAPALAQSAPAAPAPAAKPDPAYEAAKAAFDPLSEADRKAIQEALIWTGDFAGAGAGGFGPMTYRAIVAFQKRQKAAADGVLQPKDRADLLAAAERARQASRFARVVDPRSGVRIGVPQRWLEKSQPVSGGTRYLSADGAMLLETISLPGGEADLPALYDRYKADGPGRKTTYKALRPDWFVTAADLDGRKTYTRVSSGPGGLRGFTFTYPTAGGPELDRLVIAVANSFEPFPTAPAKPLAAASPSQPAAPQPSAPPPAALGPALVGSAVAVGNGRFATTAYMEGCQALSVGRKAARIVKEDKAAGLSLLDVAGLRPAPVALAPALPEDAATLVALGYSGSPDPQLLVTPAEARVKDAATLRIFAGLQKGAGGSPAFDRQGRVVGLVAGSAPEPRLVAGVAPQTSWPMVGAAAVARFVGETPTAPPPAAEPLTAGRIAALAQGAVLPVECQKGP
jgi:peptidoglycan hydrolase-like protein with peptidoglycan-binding domain